MLDTPHTLVLRAVDSGDAADSPALRNLVACGLVVEVPAPRRYEVSPQGRAALEASKPSRLAGWAIRILAVSVGVLAAINVIEWVAG